MSDYTKFEKGDVAIYREDGSESIVEVIEDSSTPTKFFVRLRVIEVLTKSHEDLKPVANQGFVVTKPRDANSPEFELEKIENWFANIPVG